MLEYERKKVLYPKKDPFQMFRKRYIGLKIKSAFRKIEIMFLLTNNH